MSNGVIQIHGRAYHTVAKRVNDWREKHAVTDGWMVSTDILEMSPEHCVVKAQLVDPEGRTISTGHAHERSEWLSGGMANSIVEVAETSAVGRALAFAGFGGGGEIASADEVQRRNVPQKLAPVKLRQVVEALQEAFTDDDSHAVLEIREEWDNEHWEYIAGTLQTWERSSLRKHLEAARKARDSATDPKFIEPAPLENERADKEASRRAANG